MSTSIETLRALCIKMRAAQVKKENAEADLELINAELDELRRKKIPDMCEALGIRNATFEGIGRVQLAADLYCSTASGRKEEAMEWLRDCGYADMIAETYNATSMKGLIRRLIEDGTEVPDFIVVTPFTRASIVKV